jgi:hypothetical protein
MFWTKFIYHTDPELPAKAVFTDLELEFLKVRNPKIDKIKLTLREALRLVARFLNCRGSC